MLHQGSVRPQLQETEKFDRLRLIRCENVGPVTFQHLLKRYGSAGAALKEIPELAKKGGRKKPLMLYSKAATKKEWEETQKLGGGFMIAGDKDYPYQLENIDSAPPVLAYLGHPHLTKKPTIGIVGGRNASLNGIKLAKRFAEVLGERDYICASGLARGIDAAVHEGSLTTGTIAAIAGGLDIIYPPENKKLHEQIAENGLIVSEMPLGAKPQARHFPRRNRIISGLSQAILVIEAAIKSGSLITAKYALDQGRDVFAVPGSPLDSRARGCNELIRQGAFICETPDDITTMMQKNDFSLAESNTTQSDYLNYDQVTENKLSKLRQKFDKILSTEPIEINEISRQLECEVSTILCLIIEAELAGKVIRHPGNRISILSGEMPF